MDSSGKRRIKDAAKKLWRERFRAFGFPVLLTLFTVLACVIYADRIIRVERRQVYRISSDSAMQQITTLNVSLNGMYAALETYARSLATAEDFSFGAEGLLRQLAAVQSGSNFTNITLIDGSGTAYTSDGKKLDYSDNRYFAESMRGQRAIELVAADHVVQQRRYVLSVPLEYAGQVRGVVAGTFSPETFRTLLTSETYESSGYSFVCDGSGRVIIGTGDGGRLTKVDNVLDELGGHSETFERVSADLAAGREGSAEYLIENERQYAVYRYTGINDWMLFHVVPHRELEATVSASTNMAFTMIGGMGLLSLAMLFYTYFSNRRRRRQAELEREDLLAAVKHSGHQMLSYRIEDGSARAIGGDGVFFISDLTGKPGFAGAALADGRILRESADEFSEFFHRIRSGEPQGSVDFHIQREDGRKRWIHAEYSLIYPRGGKAKHAIISLYDNTDQREKELAYQGWRNAVSSLMSVSVFYFEANLSKDLLEEAEGMTSGYFTSEQGERRMSDMVRYDCRHNVHPEDAREVEDFFDCGRLLALYAQGVKEDHIEYRSSIAGELRWYQAGVHMAGYPSSGDVKLFAAFSDVDDAHREMEQLSDRASRDAVTGLLNRDATEREIRALLSAAGEKDRSALFMADLDNFKQVNDTRGHQAGDQALRDIALTISDAFRKGDVVGRIGGDEFMAFLPLGAARDIVEAKAAALTAAMQFLVDGVPVTASIGVAVCQGGSKSFEQLYAEADKALYSAKTAGKNRHCVYDDGGADDPAEAARSQEYAVSVQFQTLLENMDGGVVLAEVDENEEIRLVYVSKGFYHTMGRSEEEFKGDLGRKLVALIAPEDRDLVRSSIRQAARQAEAVDCTYRVDGGGWRHIRMARLPEDAGGPASVIGVITDITELKRSEERLRLAEERYRVALKQAGGLIWEVDINARTLYQSEEVSRAFGMEGTVFPDAPEGVLSLDAVHPDSRGEYRHMFRDIYDGVEGESYTLLLRDGQGGYVYVNSHFELVRDLAGEARRAIGVSEKVTNIEADMRIFDAEARFVSLIAPYALGTFRANLKTDEVEQDAVDQIGGADVTYSDFVERLGALTEQGETLAAAIRPEALLSHFQSGHGWRNLPIRHWKGERKGLRSLLTVRLLRHPVSGEIFAFGVLKDVEVQRCWEEGLPVPVKRDGATKLYARETFLAMVKEGIRRMGEEERCSMTVCQLSGTEEIMAQQGMQMMQLLQYSLGQFSEALCPGNAVVGMADELQVAVFRREVASELRQRDTVERARIRFSELLRQVVADVKAEVSCGFTVKKKLEADAEEMLRQAIVACNTARQWSASSTLEYTAPDSVAPSEEGAAPGPGEPIRSILIVEDEPVSRIILKNALRQEYRVDEAETGRQALEMLQKNRYALVISDIQMPEMTGWDVLEKMKADKALSETPIVILTADSNAESEIRALMLGAADVIVKPFVAKTLLSRTRNIIGRQEAARMAEMNRIYELRFQQQARLLRMAERDELTGLFNREAFYRRVRERLAEDRETPYLIMRWDLDNFKVLNDTLGVESGDRLLADAGMELSALCGDEGVYARLEADHFVHFLPANSGAAEALFERISAWFARYPLEFQLIVRAGVYQIADANMDVSIMCDRALMALRSIKGSFQNRIAYFDASLRSKLLEEQELSSEMAEALSRGQFTVYFQPQHNYATGEMIGAEALVRWNHPDKGMISPAKFIPVFERNGFIAALDEHVWEESAKCIRRWMDEGQGFAAPPVSVNISRIDIYDSRLPEKLTALVEKYQIPVHALKLEITESAYMENPEQLIGAVKRLQAAGFSVGMDDFGAGYSSLNILKDVPVDVLKLDVRFLSPGGDDERGRSILSSIIRMAADLKLPVIAEGVENQEQADSLLSMNCVYMQGYYFARPMPAADFERLLGKSASAPGHSETDQSE